MVTMFYVTSVYEMFHTNTQIADVEVVTLNKNFALLPQFLRIFHFFYEWACYLHFHHRILYISIDTTILVFYCTKLASNMQQINVKLILYRMPHILINIYFIQMYILFLPFATSFLCKSYSAINISIRLSILLCFKLNMNKSESHQILRIKVN